MNLILAARSGPKLEEVAAMVGVPGIRIITVPTDLVNGAALNELVATAHQEFGAVDVLVNNAVITQPFPYHKFRTLSIEQMICVNLTAPMVLTRLVLPRMLERRRGHIVNISSLAGKVGLPYNGPYAATKAGLISLTKSLRAEYQGTGVSASVVCPGFVEAGMYQRWRDRTGRVAPRILGRSSPEAVARAVVRAIERDVPEVLVNPGPTRLLVTLAEFSPVLAEKVVRRLGVADWFRTTAEVHERKLLRSGVARLR